MENIVKSFQNFGLYVKDKLKVDQYYGMYSCVPNKRAAQLI